MTKDFLKLIKDINPQIPEAQQVPDSVNINRITPRDIRLKLLKTKGKEKLSKEIFVQTSRKGEGNMYYIGEQLFK